MPASQVAARGGAQRWRTICPHGKRKGARGHKCDGPYRHVAIVPKAGPRGGHTVAGPERR